MQDQNRLISILSAILLFILPSCSPRIYLPDRVNAPMLREAGDVKLTTSFKLQNSSSSRLGFSPSFDFAVSPVKSLGILASYRSTSRYANDEDWDWNGDYQDSIHYSGNKYEIGAGYYSTFGKGIFEFYGGYAFGNMNRDDMKYNTGEYQTKFHQVFIQPCIGLHGKEIIDFSGGIRFAYHWFKDFSSGDPDLRYAFTAPQSDIESNTFVIAAPYVNLNVGYKFVKFNAQLGANFSIGSPSLLQGTLPFYASMGATFAFAPRFLKHNEE